MRISDWSSDVCSSDLRGPVILRAEDGADWERGGLYKPTLMKEGDTFYLFYNAKTTGEPWHEQTGLATSKDLKTWTRHRGNPIIPNGPRGAPDARFASDSVLVKHRGRWGLFSFGLVYDRSDENTTELQSLMGISFSVFCWQ